ncbi:family 16 glycosylhydrolase, partial [Roseivivax halodurans]|uniref:family 16 glycosylhydrolase n=2 Tax=Roseivivax halodurans TaxID=93683 RepID=UPI000684B01A
MVTYSSFETSFETPDLPGWRISDYTNTASWIATSFVPGNVVSAGGLLELQLDGRDDGGKPFSGGEIRLLEQHYYGTYEVTMKPSAQDGTLSSFFLYTGQAFGTPTSEIDIEFLGNDTTGVLLTVHTPEGADGAFIDLGFDAANDFHTYTIEWAPDAVSWYVDGILLREIENPEIGLPTLPAFPHMSIWTGDNAFTGSPYNSVVTHSQYEDFSYTPRTAPVAIHDRAHVAAGGTIEIDLLANDGVMGDTPRTETLLVTEAPEHGVVSVDPATGRVTYTPNPGYAGRDTFFYTTSDGAETSNIAEVTILVDIPIDEEFTYGPGGFVYADDALRETAQPDYASGTATGGALELTLGGGSSRNAVTDISGGWSRSFDTLAGQTGTLTLSYRMDLTGDLDAGEWGEVVVLLDGVETVLTRLEATDDDDEVLGTGLIEAVIDLGTLSGSSHVLTLGGYLNQRTRPDEVISIAFDNVSLALSSP